jgi:hypothetical protein
MQQALVRSLARTRAIIKSISMTVSAPFELVLELMSEVASLRDQDNFSGLGVIFYKPPIALPVIPLGSVERFPQRLPIGGIKPMAHLLAEISSITSPWHDGFHLVDSDLFAITHVSQFFSPPVDLVLPRIAALAPIGARQMAAILGSMLASVEYVALLNGRAQLSVFQSGKSLHTVE